MVPPHDLELLRAEPVARLESHGPWDSCWHVTGAQYRVAECMKAWSDKASPHVHPLHEAGLEGRHSTWRNVLNKRQCAEPQQT